MNAVHQTVANIFRLMNGRFLLQEGARRDRSRATTVQESMILLLEHKEQLAMERLFRLLGLLYPAEDVRSIYRGIQTTNRKIRASSQELLENLLQQPLRDPLIALIDEIEVGAKLDRAGRFHERFRFDYESLLRVLLQEGGVGMRSLVICHVGELRLHRLQETIEMLPSDLGGLIATTVNRTLELLAGSPEKVRDES
jgi:AAA family ATP:ADP antiporter